MLRGMLAALLGRNCTTVKTDACSERGQWDDGVCASSTQVML